MCVCVCVCVWEWIKVIRSRCFWEWRSWNIVSSLHSRLQFHSLRDHEFSRGISVYLISDYDKWCNCCKKVKEKKGKTFPLSPHYPSIHSNCIASLLVWSDILSLSLSVKLSCFLRRLVYKGERVAQKVIHSRSLSSYLYLYEHFLSLCVCVYNCIIH